LTSKNIINNKIITPIDFKIISVVITDKVSSPEINLLSNHVLKSSSIFTLNERVVRTLSKRIKI